MKIPNSDDKYFWIQLIIVLALFLAMQFFVYPIAFLVALRLLGLPVEIDLVTWFAAMLIILLFGRPNSDSRKNKS